MSHTKGRAVPPKTTAPKGLPVGEDLLAAILYMIVGLELSSPVDYDARNRLVKQALVQADLLGMPNGIRVDPAEPEWPVAFIELPTGQVSWHLPQHAEAWDGHDKGEALQRCDAYVAERLHLPIPTPA